LEGQVFLHPIWANVQAFVARISLGLTFSDMDSSPGAVVARIVLAAFDFDETSLEVRIGEELVN
jgi:hypothetical protein